MKKVESIIAEPPSLYARKKPYRDGLDLYETPTQITTMLLNLLQLPQGSEVLEPANGMGAISKVIESAGYDCHASDIRDGVNFFDFEDNPRFDAVITNPPYRYAQEFVEKALKQVKKSGLVVMLLRLSFLESIKRYEFFRSSGLRTVYVSCKRITMFPFDTEKPKNSGTLAYAWYVFKNGYSGLPVIDWFNYGQKRMNVVE